MNKLRMPLLSAVLVFTFGFGANLAHGQLTPSADAYTNTASPTTNYGTAATINVESASQTGYIQFDLSAIPIGLHERQHRQSQPETLRQCSRHRGEF